MLEWIEKNLNLLTDAKSIFTLRNGEVDKQVKILKVSPQLIELDNFFEDDLSIFFIINLKKHKIELKIQNISKNGTTLFTPISHEESEVERSEKRIDLIEAGIELKMSNIISDFEIAAQIDFNDSKIDRITYTYIQALKKYFSYADIYFFHEIMTSARGKVVKEFRKPMFIADLDEPSAKDNDLPGTIPSEVFFKRVKPFDRKIPKDSRMDITVPILYNNLVPYGFIQVNSKAKIPDTILIQLKKIANKMTEQLRIAKIIQIYEKPLIVTDISYRGLGTAFTDRKLVTLFKNNAMVYFDIHFSERNSYPAVAFVRNVGSAGKGLIKSGLEFHTLPVSTETVMMSYLSAFSGSQTAADSPQKAT